jgi:ADP-ribose pyrophosphatase YjhB (NUDIX family)
VRVLLAAHLVLRVLQRYWRFTRGLTLAAAACVVDSEGKVLLVKSAGPGWTLPGGTVREGETLWDTLERTLKADCGIAIGPSATLCWIYPEADRPGVQQTGLFLVTQWEQAQSLSPESAAYFSRDRLPAAISAETAARIGHALEGRTAAEVC